MSEFNSTMIRELSTSETLTVSGGDRMETCAARYLAPIAQLDKDATWNQHVKFAVAAIREYVQCVAGKPIT
jgi:hypothetical protein